MSLQPNILKVDAQLNNVGDNDLTMNTFRKTKQSENAPGSSEFKHYDGRRWHGLEKDRYMLPNDEPEGERLDLQHQIFKEFFDGNLYLAPINTDTHSTKRILDVGAGTGIWTIECAEEYPDAEVVGLDISTIQPGNVPGNCKFVTADVEKDWTFSATDDNGQHQKFTYIHTRLLFLGLHDWKQFFKRCYDNLEPGGWMESLEFQYPVQICDQVSPDETSALINYTQKCREAGLKAGLTGFDSNEFTGMLHEIGFDKVQRLDYQVPIGTWSEGARYKAAGSLMEANCHRIIPALSSFLQRHLGYTKEDVDDMIKASIEELGKFPFYLPM